jgi:hypothetical protein
MPPRAPGKQKQKKLFRGTPKYRYSSPKGRLLTDRIFSEFEHWIRGDSTRIETKPGVRASTVCDWLAKWRKDPNWRPYQNYRNSKHCRVFTDEQEAELMDIIKSKFLEKGCVFTDGDFRLSAIDKY